LSPGAATVRTIFRCYLDLGSMGALIEDLDRRQPLGIRCVREIFVTCVAPVPRWNAFLPTGETVCVAGVVGFELRCAERKFISLRCRVISDSSASAETAAVPRENDLLC
jgi:hypothetical protein